jgi:translation elongation factor EF-4
MQGTLQVKDKIMAKSLGKSHVVDSVGVFTPSAIQPVCLKPVKLALWLLVLKIFWVPLWATPLPI